MSKLKTLLSQHGVITRVYLEEEDKSKRKRRKKAGGGGGKRYTEGWVEFDDKRHAKTAAEGLHMTNMERKGTHCEDLWTMRYLKGFKWDMLTEKVSARGTLVLLFMSEKHEITGSERNYRLRTRCLRARAPGLAQNDRLETIGSKRSALALLTSRCSLLAGISTLFTPLCSHVCVLPQVAYERRVREQKLRIEMVNAKKELKEFEKRVEEGEKFEKMEQRKRKKGQDIVLSGKGEFKREFRQKKVLEDE